MIRANFYDSCIKTHSSTPEVKRLSPERLLLKMKDWHLFEPSDILKEIIDPLLDVDFMKPTIYLKDIGALVVKDYMEDEIELTDLGKIYLSLPLDVKLTRLILFGFVFKCMNQAMIVACIHSQGDSIFVEEREDSFSGILKLKLNYDQADCSDSIMMLRIFEEWYDKFYKTHYDSKRDNGKFPRPPKGPPDEDELDWCQEGKRRFINWPVMRRVLLLLEEIRFKLIRFKFDPADLNKKWEHDEFGVTILKTVICGAFQENYLNGEYKDPYERDNHFDRGIISKSFAHRSLLYKVLPFDSKSSKYSKIMSDLVGVSAQNLETRGDKTIITLSKECESPCLISNLKKCFQIENRPKKPLEEEKRPRNYDSWETNSHQDSSYDSSSFFDSNDEGTYDSNNESSNNKSGGTKKKKEDRLKNCFHLNQVSLKTIRDDVKVETDIDSVNFVIFQNDPTKLSSTGYCSQSIYTINGVKTARCLTKMPE